MCTLIVVHRRVEGRPLIVAANRDEFLDRPSEGPGIRQTRVGRVLAPLDVRAGGTWLGLNERGVFAALTNLRTNEPDSTRRSRGDVVLEALGEATAADAARRLERLDTEAYNPFNLFIADERDARVVVYRDRPRVETLAPGAHVIGNVEANGAPNEKVIRIQREVDAALEGEDEALLDRLSEVCRSHAVSMPAGEVERAQREQREQNAEAPAAGPAERIKGSSALGDTCVHVKGTYGTRSSLLLELGEGLHDGRLLHADGPPCRTAYEDVSSLLIELGRRPAAETAGAQMRTAS